MQNIHACQCTQKQRRPHRLLQNCGHTVLPITSVSETIRKAPLAKAQITPGKQKIRSMERRYQSHCRTSVKSCFPTQNFTEIGQSAAELRPKTILNMTAVRHLEFLKIHIWSRDLQIPFLLMFFINPPSVLYR